MKLILRYFVFLLSIQRFTDCKIIRRYYYTGILFEDYHPDSKHLDFADTEPEDWKNLTELAKKHDMKSKGVFCAQGEGAWIAYPKESFKHGSLSYQLIIGEHCVPVDSINSIQPLGYVYGSKHTGLAHFKEPYFASEATLVGNVTVQGDMKSLVYLGSEPWTLKAEGRTGSVNVCLVRDPFILKVCIFPDLVSQLGLKSASVTLKPQCEDKKLEHYYAQNCYEPGVHTLVHEFDLMLEPIKKVCTGGDKPDEKDKIATKFATVMEIWSARILYDAEEYGLIHGGNQDATFKVDLMMEVVDIFAQGCPRVSMHYLSILANVFVMHLREVWNDRTMVGRPDETWTEVWDFISHCGAAVAMTDENKGSGLPMTCKPRFNDPINVPNQFERLAMELISQGDPFDVVIEQMWLILNFVAPYCSHVEGYHNNLWNDFPTLFKKHYLAPVEKQWMEPGDWQTFYPSMFNGFDIVDQHQGIVTCIQSVNKMTPLYDPVGRTSGFDGLFWQYNVTSIASRTDDDEESNSHSKKNDTTPAGRSTVLKPRKKGADDDVKGKKGKTVEKRKDKDVTAAKRGRKMIKKGRKMVGPEGMKRKKGEKSASETKKPENSTEIASAANKKAGRAKRPEQKS